MRKVKLTLEYDGSDFYGWQVQAKTGARSPKERVLRTVQGTLEAALSDVPGAVPRVMAAGRTDAGVHALAMTAHYLTADTVPISKTAAALNARLPGDVRVLNAETASPDFEAQFGCLYRRYEYRLRQLHGERGLAGSALERKRILFLPQRLDVGAMQAAAPQFEGTRDFAALATQETRGTVRTLYRCRLSIHGADLCLHVAADGFLRNMVRALVGTLLWVGEGKLNPEAVPALLATKDRRRMGPNVPPHGLYFAEAGYTPWVAERSPAESFDR